MLLLVVFRSKINVVTGTVLLLFFFAVAVLVIYLALTSFYRDVAVRPTGSLFGVERPYTAEGLNR